MNINELRETLKTDEGQVNEIYNDHLGYATFGIGHLVIDGDPEKGQPLGTPITEQRVSEVFEKLTIVEFYTKHGTDILKKLNKSLQI